MKNFSLKDKVAIVTGAAGLIGKSFCEALKDAGAQVIATDINTNEDLNNYFFQYSDITNELSVQQLANNIIETFGKIDILVNNAAINDMFEDPKSTYELSKFENYPLELWNRSINVNLTGTFICSKIIGKEMLKNGKGSIINIASTYGINAPDQSLYKNKEDEQIFFKPPAYSASKGGVIMLTKFMAAYWGKSGIRVNTLSPGGVENGQDEFFINNYSKKTPLNRMATVDDYKGAIVFLASDASSYMTGANLIIDGGWTTW
jgi:NAD(P)-dependent dehydrogenase (short-subunit alcohol dehydrogenase family)